MSIWANCLDVRGRSACVRVRLVTGAGVLAAAVGFADPGVASAHGGPDGAAIASDFRTELTAVTPEVPGLSIEVVDITGTLQLSWNGEGEVIVAGYEGEPYLRVTSSSVERNLESPATYLNADSSGTAPVPDGIEPTGPPRWERLPETEVARWHDHRVHWMAPVLPPEVQAEPTRSHLVFDRWVIPVTVGDAPVEIAGTLSWVPPPNRGRWIAGAIVIGVATLIAARRHTRSLVFAAGAAVACLTIDSVGLAIAASGGLVNQAWNLRWPVVCGLLIALMIRRTDAPHGRHSPLLAGITGLALALMGGFDRFEVLSRSQVLSAFPATVSRVSAVVSLGVGVVLIGSFIVALTSTPPHNTIQYPDPEQVPT